MDVSSIITEVQNLFGDNREVLITRAQVLSWVSEAQRVIARNTECVQGSQVYNIVDFGTTYSGHALPSSLDFYKEAAVEWLGGPLKKISREDLNAFSVNLGANAAETPVNYFIWGPKLYLWPYPSKANSSGPLRLWFYALPPYLSNESQPLTVPVQFHSELIDFALMKARERNEDPDMARRNKEQWDERLALARGDAFNPHGESFTVIRDDPADVW